MNLLDYIPSGKENAISREKLVLLTGLDDRAVRGAIQRLVEKGEPIFSSSSHKGYWYSDDIDELERFINEREHRIHTEQKTLSNLKKRLYELKNIKVVPVRQHYRRIDSGNIDGQIEMVINQ